MILEDPKRTMLIKQNRHARIFWNLSISRPSKSTKYDGFEIIFTENNVNGVHFHQNDAFVVEVIMENHGM